VLKIGKVFGARASAAPTLSRAGQRQRAARAARSLKTQGRTIPWRHAAIYAALVVVAGVAIALWDHAYEARQADALKPPPPEVVAKNLVEDVVGLGSVSNVVLDQKASSLEMTVQDVLLKPGQSRDEQRKNVSAEGGYAIQFLENRMPLKKVTLHIMKANKALATVSYEAGQKTPTTQFGPDLQ